MKKQIITSLIFVIIFSFAYFSYAEVSRTQTIANYGDIGAAYDDLSSKLKTPDERVMFIDAAGDLGVLYDNANQYTAEQLKIEIDKIYAKAGVSRGFLNTKALIISLIFLTIIAVIYFLRSKIKNLKVSKLAQDLINNITNLFGKKATDIVEIIKQIDDNKKEAVENGNIADALDQKFREGTLAEIKNPEKRKEIQKQLEQHIGRLNIWVTKIKEMLSSTAQITEKSKEYLSDIAKEITEEDKIINNFTQEFLSPGLKEKIANFEQKSADEKKELAGILKLSNDFNFVLGHFKERIQDEITYILDERKAIRDLIKYINKRNNSKMIDCIKMIKTKAKEILSLFSPETAEENLDKELSKIKTDIYAILSEYSTLKKIDLERIKVETELSNAHVQGIVLKVIETRKEENKQAFIPAMNKLYEACKNSERGVRITLVQNGIDENVAKQLVKEYKNFKLKK